MVTDDSCPIDITMRILERRITENLRNHPSDRARGAQAIKTELVPLIRKGDIDPMIIMQKLRWAYSP